MLPSRDIERLIAIMARLRTPGTGCPWDLKQDFRSIVPYTIEEAFEVADAIERDDKADLREELGDLLLQVVFHARLAEEEGSFVFGDVVEAITTKLIRRHPHVFGDTRDLTPDQVKRLWAEIKAIEKAERAERRALAATPVPAGLLADISATFPPLLRATRLQTRAASVGFDWSEAEPILAKIEEELWEVRAALEHGDPTAQQDEIGDLLFAVVNLARHAKVDPEMALRGTNEKFTRRFAFIERGLEAKGVPLAEATLDVMEELWTDAKRTEREASEGSGEDVG